MPLAKGRKGLPKRVLDLLAEHSPLTSREVAEELGVPVTLACTALNKLNKKPNRLVYVSKYVEQSWDTLFVRPFAAYKLGDLPNARRPPPKGKEQSEKQNRQRKKKLVNSVFNIGALDVKVLFGANTISSE